MKITKDLLRTLIKEEINQMDEIFGFGKKKKGKTVKVNTSKDFPVEHRFLSGIELAYDKSKDAFVGKELFTNNAPTKTFKNTPGNFDEGRSSEGMIYAIAFKRMFKKEAPAPKKASGGSGQSQADASQKGGDQGMGNKIKRQVGGTVKVGENVVAIKFNARGPLNRSIYQKRRSKVVKVLKQLGFEKAKDSGREKDGFWLFEV